MSERKSDDSSSSDFPSSSDEDQEDSIMNLEFTLCHEDFAKWVEEMLSKKLDSEDGHDPSTPTIPSYWVKPDKGGWGPLKAESNKNVKTEGVKILVSVEKSTYDNNREFFDKLKELLEKNYWKEVTVPSTTLGFLIKIIQATQSNDADRSEGIKALKKEISELDESVQKYYTDLLNLLSLKKGMSSLSLSMFNSV